jgi:hypothetical protein
MATTANHEARDDLDPSHHRNMDRLRDALRKRIDTRLRATMLAKPVFFRRAVSTAQPDARILLRNLVDYEAVLLEKQEGRMRGLGDEKKADVLGFVRTRILREVRAELLPLVPSELDAPRPNA